MTINVLGEEYTIQELEKEEDERLSNAYGFMDWTAKEIVIEKDIQDSDLKNIQVFRQKVLRHEIIHAFLCESGLEEMTDTDGPWAMNEEIIDWFARQGPKIFIAWQTAGAI